MDVNHRIFHAPVDGHNRNTLNQRCVDPRISDRSRRKDHPGRTSQSRYLNEFGLLVDILIRIAGQYRVAVFPGRILDPHHRWTALVLVKCDDHCPRNCRPRAKAPRRCGSDGIPVPFLPHQTGWPSLTPAVLLNFPRTRTGRPGAVRARGGNAVRTADALNPDLTSG